MSSDRGSCVAAVRGCCEDQRRNQRYPTKANAAINYTPNRKTMGFAHGVVRACRDPGSNVGRGASLANPTGNNLRDSPHGGIAFRGLRRSLPPVLRNDDNANEPFRGFHRIGVFYENLPTRLIPI